jgi:hypothetical protein
VSVALDANALHYRGVRLGPKATLALLGGRRIDCWNWDQELSSEASIAAAEDQATAPFCDVTYPRFQVPRWMLGRWWSPKLNKIGIYFTWFSNAPNRADAKMEKM